MADFYHDGALDPSAWESLAAQFAAANRPHRAAAIRHKLHILQILETNPRHFVEQAGINAEKLSLWSQ